MGKVNSRKIEDELTDKEKEDLKEFVIKFRDAVIEWQINNPVEAKNLMRFVDEMKQKEKEEEEKTDARKHNSKRVTTNINSTFQGDVYLQFEID